MEIQDILKKIGRMDTPDHRLMVKAGIMYVLSRAVSEGYLSTVNGKHGVHIPDELYEELSNQAKTK